MDEEYQRMASNAIAHEALCAGQAWQQAAAAAERCCGQTRISANQEKIGGQTMKYIACVGIGFFFGWLYAHSVIATECRKLGRFYVGNSVFNCTEDKP